RFAPYKNPAFSIQGIQQICKVPNLVSFQVQYYIPPEHSKECFISAYIPNKANKSSQFRCNPAGRKPKGVPKGQHYFTDNIVFEAEYIGSKLLTTSSIEVVIYDGNRNLCSKVIRGRQTWKKLNVPTRFTFCGKNPKDSELGPIDSEEIQGIAHSRTHWYISNKSKIYKTRKNNIKSVVKRRHINEIKNKLTSGHYNHFGDMDFYNGYLYVATTGKDNAPSIVVVFDRNLNFIKYGKFPRDKQKGAGWLAINPLTEYLYSSEPYRNLHIYSRNFSNGSFLKPIGDIWLHFKYGAPSTKEWGKVWNQGGAFSPHGIFYYVLDHKADENCKYTGIHAFIIKKYASEITIRGKNNKKERVNFMNEKYDPDFGDGWKRKWEFEGITIWDRGTEGQIHTLQLHNEAGNDDDVHLFHYKVNKDY
ncbi:MAG: hypothetical protein KJN62_08240, partial [Deltaproteobacteria bacterium]|nr:hypothetical protein [Deltaproteobacteria bacterium]